MFGTTGDGPGCFNDPAGLGVDGVGNMVVADSRNHCMCLFTKEGKFVSNLILSPKVMRPSGLMLDRVNKKVLFCIVLCCVVLYCIVIYCMMIWCDVSHLSSTNQGCVFLLFRDTYSSSQTNVTCYKSLPLLCKSWIYI